LASFVTLYRTISVAD